MLECRGRSNVGVGICGAPARITLYTSANTAFLAKILGAGFLRASRKLGCAAAKTLGIDLMMWQACRIWVLNASLLTQYTGTYCIIIGGWVLSSATGTQPATQGEPLSRAWPR